MQDHSDVLEFWFEDHDQDDWFGGKADFDRAVADRFGQLHEKVARGEAWSWRESTEGRLAEILVLDQLSRQLHRNSPIAYRQDKMALVLAQEAVGAGHDADVDPHRAMFFYMPFMHAESLVVQNEGVRLFQAMGDEDLLKYMLDHRDTIARFGRFPFRNKVLGRDSTPEELAYMDEMGDRVF